MTQEIKKTKKKSIQKENLISKEESKIVENPTKPAEL